MNPNALALPEALMTVPNGPVAAAPVALASARARWLCVSVPCVHGTVTDARESDAKGEVESPPNWPSTSPVPSCSQRASAFAVVATPPEWSTTVPAALASDAAARAATTYAAARADRAMPPILCGTAPAGQVPKWAGKESNLDRSRRRRLLQASR